VLNETAYFDQNSSSNLITYKYRLCAFYNNITLTTTQTTPTSTTFSSLIINATNTITTSTIDSTSKILTTNTSIMSMPNVQSTSSLSSTSTVINTLTVNTVSIFDNSINVLSFINISYVLLTELKTSSNTLILCENTSTPFIKNLNLTISSLIDTIKILNETNTTEVDIIDYWRNESLSSFKDIPSALINVTILLNEIINDQKYQNNDISVRISGLITIVDTLKSTFNSYKYFSIGVSDFINQAIFPKAFSGFSQIKIGVSNLVNILTQLSTTLATVKSLHNSNGLNWLVYKKYKICQLTFDQVYQKISTMENKFEAINQLTFIMNEYSKLIYDQFIDYRYQVFLAETYNTSISTSLNLTDQAADNLYSILFELNNPLNLIYEFNSLNNNSDLNSAFKNSTIYLNSSIFSIGEYLQKIIIMNSSSFTAIETTVNNTNYLMKLFFDYINVLLNQTNLTIT
jgi:hypothetical protein